MNTTLALKLDDKGTERGTSSKMQSKSQFLFMWSRHISGTDGG